MKIVQPIVKTHCICADDRIQFSFDRHGAVDMFCVEHGPLQTIEALEFDSREDWEAWRAAQQA